MDKNGWFFFRKVCCSSKKCQVWLVVIEYVCYELWTSGRQWGWYSFQKMVGGWSKMEMGCLTWVLAVSDCWRRVLIVENREGKELWICFCNILILLWNSWYYWFCTECCIISESTGRFWSKLLGIIGYQILSHHQNGGVLGWYGSWLGWGLGKMSVVL